MALSRYLIEAYDREEGNPHVVATGTETLSNLALTRSVIHSRSKSMDATTSSTSELYHLHKAMSEQLGYERNSLVFKHRYDNGIETTFNIHVSSHFVERLFLRYGTVINDGKEYALKDIVPRTYYVYDRMKKMSEDDPKYKIYKEEITRRPETQIFRLRVTKDYINKAINETVARGFFNLIFSNSDSEESEGYRKLMSYSTKAIRRRSIASTIVSEFGTDKDGNIEPLSLIASKNAFDVLRKLFQELGKHGVTNFNQYKFILVNRFYPERNPNYEKLDLPSLPPKTPVYTLGDKVIIVVPSLEPAIIDLLSITEYIQTYGKDITKTTQHFQDGYHTINDVLKKGRLADTYQYNMMTKEDRKDIYELSSDMFLQTIDKIGNGLSQQRLTMFSKEFGMSINCFVTSIKANQNKLNVDMKLMTVTAKDSIGIGNDSRFILTEDQE